MGNIIFSGSWLWFIIFIVIWGASFIYTKKKGYIFKNEKLNTIAMKWIPFIYGGILAVIIASNFQYTSRNTSDTVRGFDNYPDKSEVEVKKSSRMTAEDAGNKLQLAIEKSKQEISK